MFEKGGKVSMKKARLAASILTGLLSVGVLAGCNEVRYSKEGYILTDKANGVTEHYTADDLFKGYITEADKAQTLFDNVYKLIVKNYFKGDSQEIKDLYTGDLLSWVMGHVRSEESVLLTVLNTVNLIAVATLLDLSAIVFCEGVMPSSDVIEKANEEGVCLFVSNDTTFHTALKIHKLEK